MKGLRKAYRGERGFTLVELLVVIVILGVLAAVATLAVTRFMGSGTLESAKTELHQAQTSIAAAMAATGVATINEADGTEYTGEPGQITCGSDNNTADASEFVMGSAFRAAYEVDHTGEITGANLDSDLIDKPWDGIVWVDNGWEAEP